MKKTLKNNWTLEVNDDLRKGVCSLEEHFKQTIENYQPWEDQFGQWRTQNPYLEALTLSPCTNEEIGDLIELKKDGEVVRSWAGNFTLQLGDISEEIVRIMDAEESKN